MHLCLAPLSLLAYLVMGYSATYAALVGTGVAFVAPFLRKNTRPTRHTFRPMIDDIGTQASQVAIPIAAIGVIIAVAIPSNLAIKFSTRLMEISGGTLLASVGSQTIWSGATTALWTLGGSFPGPTIRVARRAGFSARIENRLSEPANVHWHGLASPAEMDGHPSDVIAPGQSRDIAFPIVDRATEGPAAPGPTRP